MLVSLWRSRGQLSLVKPQTQLGAIGPRFPAISGGAGSFSRANDGACFAVAGAGARVRDGHSPLATLLAVALHSQRHDAY